MPVTAEDARNFRHVLGHFPTGVVAVTAIGTDGLPVGMTVGSFTSVSLDPPLVAFFPDHASTSFPRIRASGRFCVNVLGADQEHVCRSFATKGADKFAGITWQAAPSGSPIIDGVVAWIDCVLENVQEAGDHFIVLARILDMGAAHTHAPLLFFRGGYGQFTSPTLTAPAEADLIEQLRVVDRARHAMDQLSGEFKVECVASAAVAGKLVILGGAALRRSDEWHTRIGDRIPFAAPLGAPLAAWQDEREIWAWMRSGKDTTPERDLRRTLDRVRSRLWSLALIGPDGTVHDPSELPAEDARILHVSAPIFAASGRPIVQLSLYGISEMLSPSQLRHRIERLTASARVISEQLQQGSELVAAE